MKRIDAFCGMRWGILLFLFLANTTAVTAHEIDEPDSLRLELNPHDYVPLAVGNSWTYEHHYANDTYPGTESEHLKPYEIPGYPHGRDNPVPPASLTHVERRLTIEITHTEMIDGFEYYVLSDPNYSWPPLPEFFWGGKKVRLSDEGFLVFRGDGQEIPLYELDHHHLSYFGVHSENTFYLSPSMYIDRYLVRESYLQATPDPPVVGFSIHRLLIPPPIMPSNFVVTEFETYCSFVPGYGLAEFSAMQTDLGWAPFFAFLFAPISANIEGKEISYPFPARRLYNISVVQPTSWGKLKRSFLGTK